MTTNYRLISFDVYQEQPSGYYFAKAVYQCEDEQGIWEMTYPKIHLPILQSSCPIVNQEFGITGDIVTIDLGFGELPLKSIYRAWKGGEVFAERKLIKEKVHDMTIAEIEKKLGYKIKIVGEKGEEK